MVVQAVQDSNRQVVNIFAAAMPSAFVYAPMLELVVDEGISK
jgi:hypothetical protein